MREAQQARHPRDRHRRHQRRPEPVRYPIPGNDDAIRAITLFSRMVARRSRRGERSRAEGRETAVDIAAASAAHRRPPRRWPRPAATSRLVRRPASRRTRSPTPPRPTDRASGRPGAAGPVAHHGIHAPPGRRPTERRPCAGGIMAISASQVKELRETTDAGMMDCKKALHGGRRRHGEGGRVPAQEGHRRRPPRRPAAPPSQGLVGCVHPPRRQGRRAGRGQLRDRFRGAHATTFKALVHNVAMHIAAATPGRGDARRGRPRRASRRSRRSTAAQMREQGKPETMIDKIVDGQARQVLQRSLPARAEVRQGSGPDGRGLHQVRHREARREHAGPPLLALRDRRVDLASAGAPATRRGFPGHAPPPRKDPHGQTSASPASCSNSVARRWPTETTSSGTPTSPRSRRPSPRPCRTTSRWASSSGPATSFGPARRTSRSSAA